jgi:lycopene beta-cyclase
VRRQTEAQARFCRLLNWMLFRAYPPEQRYHVLERFYRLPEATVRRFYALELRLGDRARLLVGRPPAGLSLRAAFSRGQAA